MNAILWALAIVGAFVTALTVGVVAYLLVAVKLDHRAEARRRAEQGREVDAAYIASLAADERPALPQRIPSEAFASHPVASRIVDRIVANEAARIADEWEAMNR